MTVATATAHGLSSSVTGLLLTTDLNDGDRVNVLLTEDGKNFDPEYLSAALTLGDGDDDTAEVEIKPFHGVRLYVARLAQPGGRERNAIAALLLDRYMPPTADRWWLDLRGGVVITGMCHCGGPADLHDSIYDSARAVSDSIPRKGTR
ncbi:hypothetical protein [Microbispora bryophytorum]|uniref:hypothetical protein n=1 Tax=Microbispora bryophytorum TaxID=1460882 RepID=UPI00340DC0C2